LKQAIVFSMQVVSAFTGKAFLLLLAWGILLNNLNATLFRGCVKIPQLTFRTYGTQINGANYITTNISHLTALSYRDWSIHN